MRSETLTRNQFGVLADAAVCGPRSQRKVADRIGISLGSVNTATRELKQSGLLDEEGRITQSGLEALKPHKVDNAIIMAAGISSRFAPISYERPKGLLRVKGEVLIERQIGQLKEAGIDDITVVVGYMKEQFFYLEDKFGVKIRVNEEYANRNNNSTLMLVREQLGNTFICSSDNYFSENVFEPYVYQAYYAATFFKGRTDEYLLETGTGKRIVGVRIGGSDQFGMLGHAYFDRAFSGEFRRILEEEYDRPETAPKLWEDIFREHLDMLHMVMRPYEQGVVHEFDSLGELRDFDPAFIENVDSSILDNICKTLDVKRSGISGIVPISQGLTNLSFKFDAKGKQYVYRHPGAGTDKIINRESEAFSQQVGYKLGLDDTYIYEDPREGWKISRYLPDCAELDYNDWGQVEEALGMARTLHECGVESKWSFDVYEKAQELVALLDERHRASFDDFKELYALIDSLAQFVSRDGTKPCLCHNDFYNPNLLIAEGKMYLIDWEYSGMSDYASDLGTFVCCSPYGVEETERVLQLYFQRTPTQHELAHCLSYIAISSFYWFVWALYKDACGAPVGEWLYLWYKNAKAFGHAAKEAVERIAEGA
ncbi:MAG: phosphotransferase [Eggerthellaceae bacterium]|nr:phosphotransferase [Eggerthellaceae bacterium]